MKEEYNQSKTISIIIFKLESTFLLKNWDNPKKWIIFTRNNWKNKEKEPIRVQWNSLNKDQF